MGSFQIKLIKSLKYYLEINCHTYFKNKHAVCPLKCTFYTTFRTGKTVLNKQNCYCNETLQLHRICPFGDVCLSHGQIASGFLCRTSRIDIETYQCMIITPDCLQEKSQKYLHLHLYVLIMYSFVSRLYPNSRDHRTSIVHSSCNQSQQLIQNLLTPPDKRIHLP